MLSVSFGHWVRPYYVFFCTERHLGKFCFQIHEFGSDIIDDNEIDFDRLSLTRKVFNKENAPSLKFGH